MYTHTYIHTYIHSYIITYIHNYILEASPRAARALGVVAALELLVAVAVVVLPAGGARQPDPAPVGPSTRHKSIHIHQ